MDARGNLHVVWEDRCTQGTGNIVQSPNVAQPPDIFYRMRDPNGVWLPVRVVSSTGTDDAASTAPAIAVDATGKVHIVWADQGTTGGKPASYGLLHRILTPPAAGVDKNFVLDANIRVVGNPQASVPDSNPALAADTLGNVHLVWARQLGTAVNPNGHVEYAQYNGTAWSAPLAVAANGNTWASRPAITVSSQNATWVAWQSCGILGSVNSCLTVANYDILMRGITNPTTLAGTSATLVTDLNKQAGLDGDSRQPVLLVDPAGITWVFWRDNSVVQAQSRYNIWARQYNGTTAQGSYLLVSNGPGQTNADAPRVAMDATGYIAVMWTTGSAGATDIWGASGFHDSGLTAGITVATTPAASATPSVAVDAGHNMHVVFVDDSTFGAVNPGGVSQIFYSYVAKP
jgi:hypothetical protein